jgi:hypothetical protein
MWNTTWNIAHVHVRDIEKCVYSEASVCSAFSSQHVSKGACECDRRHRVGIQKRDLKHPKWRNVMRALVVCSGTVGVRPDRVRKKCAAHSRPAKPRRVPNPRLVVSAAHGAHGLQNRRPYTSFVTPGYGSPFSMLDRLSNGQPRLRVFATRVARPPSYVLRPRRLSHPVPPPPRYCMDAPQQRARQLPPCRTTAAALVLIHSRRSVSGGGSSCVMSCRSRWRPGHSTRWLICAQRCSRSARRVRTKGGKSKSSRQAWRSFSARAMARGCAYASRLLRLERRRSDAGWPA